jgi:hypothetical protein
MTDAPTKSVLVLDQANAARVASGLRAWSACGLPTTITLPPEQARALALLIEAQTETLVTRAVMRLEREQAQAQTRRALLWHFWVLAATQAVVIWDTALRVAS